MGRSTVKISSSARAGIAFALLAGSLAFGSVGSASPAYALSIDCSRGVNLSFEEPVVHRWEVVVAPGWQSPSGQIEIWHAPFGGVTPPDGDQIAELQLRSDDPTWQDIPTFEGDSIDWSFYHRGRRNEDTVDVNIGSVASQTNEGTFTTDTDAFVQYSGTYVVPTGQTTTRFVLDPVDTGSRGNLVDAVGLELECEITMTSSFGTWSDTDGSGHVTDGDSYVIEYVVTNDGSATLAAIVVTEALGDAVSCPSTTLMPGESTTCTATHTVSQAEIDAGIISSDATAEGTDAAGVTVTDPSLADQPIVHVPSLSVDKSSTVASYASVDEVLPYDIVVTNDGNVAVDDVTVVDPSADPGSVICDLVSPVGLAPGEILTCTAERTVTQDDLDAGFVENTATAEGTGPDQGVVSAEASYLITADQLPAWDVTKTATSEPLGDGSFAVSYDITVENLGNVVLTGVIIQDNLDDTFGGHPYTVESVTSSGLTVNPSYDGSSDVTVTGPDPLAFGASGTVTIEAIVGPLNDSGPFVNEALLLVDATEGQVADTAVASTEFDTGFDLALSKAGPSAVGEAEDVTWTLTVENLGPSIASGPIIVTDDLGDGLSFVSAAGAGWSCAHSAGVVTCEYTDDLAAGDESAITIVTMVTAAAGSTVINSATVASADDANEVDPSNNTAVASANVDALPVTGVEADRFAVAALALVLFGLLILLFSDPRRNSRAPV